MSGIYIGWEVAVLLNCIDSVHQLPYKLYFQKFTFNWLYSLNLQILLSLIDQIFFLKQLQIYSALSCQLVEIPGLYYSSFIFNVSFSASIFPVLLGKKAVGSYQLPFQHVSVTIKLHYSLRFCYPGSLHGSNIVAFICIWLCFVSFFFPEPNLEVQEYNTITLETEAMCSHQVQGLAGLPRKFQASLGNLLRPCPCLK